MELGNLEEAERLFNECLNSPQAEVYGLLGIASVRVRFLYFPTATK